MNTQNTNLGDKSVRVRRGRVDSVDLYEVKENELELLEKGDPNGVYLNFSIFLLSSAFTCITALATAEFKNDIIQNCFLFLAIIGIVVGVLLFILWWRGRTSIKTTITKIKNRIPPEFVEQEQSESGTNNGNASEDVTPK